MFILLLLQSRLSSVCKYSEFCHLRILYTRMHTPQLRRPQSDKAKYSKGITQRSIPSGTAQSWVDSPPSLSRERPRPHQLNPSAHTTCRTKVCAGHYENKGQFHPKCASPCPPVSFHYLPLLFRGNSKLYYWLKLKITRQVSLLQKSMNCKKD